jgi:hypothetical protein
VKISTRVLIFTFIIIGVLAIGSIAQWNKGKDKANLDGQEETQLPNNQIIDETTSEQRPIPLPSRKSMIPDDLVKITPEMDSTPPKSYSPEYIDPVPIPGLVNTAGGEDSAFIIPGGETLYFFFTPDVRVPVEKQLLDQVTGIYLSKKDGELWGKPTRVLLQDSGKLAIDGCEFVQGNTMYFASAREGYTGLHWFRAEYEEGEWRNWVNADAELKTQEYSTGELHITADGRELYFHSDKSGGRGNYDIWVSQNVDGEWGEPLNLDIVNSEGYDGWPCITDDGTELWFSRDYGIWRSKRVDGVWQEPVKMFFPLSGEPSVDREGNVYFTHHFYDDDVMLEADIYVAYKRHVEPKDVVSIPPRDYYMGFLPSSSKDQPIDDAYQMASQSSEIVPIWGRPSPFYEMADELSGVWGEAFVEGLTRGNGMIPLIHFSFIDEGLTLKIPPGLEGATLSDLDWRFAYKNAVLEAVVASEPLYLSVGNEVNRWYEEHGVDGSDGFQHFVSLYEEIYDAVKDLSPETRVFCTFSREIVDENKEADLDVLDLFDSDKMDMLVITSYPYALAGITRPKDIPDDYYLEVAESMWGKPFGFSEVTWSSLEAFGGEEGQADFLEQLVGRLSAEQDIDLRLLMWSWLTDLGEGDSTGLIGWDGGQKMAYESWLSISSGE